MALPKGGSVHGVPLPEAVALELAEHIAPNHRTRAG